MVNVMSWLRRFGLVFVMVVHSAPALGDTFGRGGNEFAIDFVTVGNAGNPGDPIPPFPWQPTSIGSVAANYRIGKFEISREIVSKASADGNLGLYMDPMDFISGGPRAQMPATGTSWNMAARLVNYLNVSRGYPVAYKFEKQPGEDGYDPNADSLDWQPSDAGYEAANEKRNRLAYYFLPTKDEWYKAAYYDPLADNASGRYWTYATGSDVAPISVAHGTERGTAVWGLPALEIGPADVMVAGGPSPYGTIGMGGNVSEFNESGAAIYDEGENQGRPTYERNVRGGGWYSTIEGLDKRLNTGTYPQFNDNVVGFRVASVPEPSEGMLVYSTSLLVIIASHRYAITRRGHAREIQHLGRDRVATRSDAVIN